MRLVMLSSENLKYYLHIYLYPLKFLFPKTLKSHIRILEFILTPIVPFFKFFKMEKTKE